MLAVKNFICKKGNVIKKDRITGSNFNLKGHE
jgi:hypothetical protein